jgi:hypothetical protein
MRGAFSVSNPAVYEELLTKTKDASKLEAWLESNRGGKRASPWESNLWALAMLAASALHFFLREIIRMQIDSLNASGADAGAQAALDLMPPQPASAADLSKAVYAFLETQRIEHDDTGRNDHRKPAAPAAPADQEDESPAAVSSALHQAQPERRLPVEVIALWAPAERVAVWKWAQHLATGGQAPPPEVLSRVYLEDLRLGDPADRTKLLGWVGIGLDAAAVNWSDELWEEVLAWARAVHRIDRGEREVEVPACPAIFLPGRQLFGEVKAFAHHAGETTRAAIVDAFGGEHPGVTLAVDALLALGELTFGPAGQDHYAATEPGLRAEVAELVAAAEALGRRADVPTPRDEQPDHPYYSYRKLSGVPLGGTVDDDIALRFSGADRRPEQLDGVALLPHSDEHFRGTINYGELAWTEDEEILGHYRTVLVDELEDELEQARAEARGGLEPGDPGFEDDEEESVTLGPEMADNITEILGDGGGEEPEPEDEDLPPPTPITKPRGRRKAGA